MHIPTELIQQCAYQPSYHKNITLTISGCRGRLQPPHIVRALRETHHNGQHEQHSQEQRRPHEPEHRLVGRQRFCCQWLVLSRLRVEYVELLKVINISIICHMTAPASSYILCRIRWDFILLHRFGNGIKTKVCR